MSVRNYIAPIVKALGPERAMVFMETVNALDMKPDDPELILAAANASIVVSLAEIPGAITAQIDRMEKVFAVFLGDVDLKVAEAFVKSGDELQTDVRVMARELAQGEYNAAGSLRSGAINDEVRALRNASAELERQLQAAEARGIVTGREGGKSLEGGSAVRVGPPIRFTMTPQLFVLLVVVLVAGVLGGAWMTKRNYTGWRPPAHAAVATPHVVALALPLKVR